MIYVVQFLLIMEIQQNPEQFENVHVRDVYNKISLHFDKTRTYTWDAVKEFTDSFQKNTLIGDIGCGNGRNCLLRKDCDFIGTDISQSFVDICKGKGINCIIADNLSLPFEDNYFDYVLSIAVIHHFCNTERRLKALSELIRVTKKYGEILVYVWAKEQSKYIYEKNNDILIPWKLQKKYNKGDNETYNRYYHLFDEGELEDLLQSFDNVRIKKKGYQCNNWYVIISKT